MDAFSISTQDRERQEGCLGHPPLRSFLQHTAHSMPFPSSERRHQNLRVHANTSASFSLCTVHLMQWILRILGKTVALTSPSPGEGLRTPQRLLILQQWFLVPGWEESTFSRAWEIMRVGHCLPTVLPQTPSTHSSWRPMVCKSVVCATAPSAPCSRTACV